MYIHAITKKYPVSESDIKKLFPTMSFSKPFVAPKPYELVFATPRPYYNPITQSVAEKAPEYVKGHWEQRWEILELSDEEAQANATAKTESIKSSLIRQVDALSDQKFWSSVPYKDTAIQFRNSEDRNNITNLRQFADLGMEIYMIMEDDSIALIPSEEFITLTNEIMIKKSAIRINARMLKNAIIAAENYTDLELIDIFSGWPV